MKHCSAVFAMCLGCMLCGCQRMENDIPKEEITSDCVAGCGVTFYELVPKKDTYSGRVIYISGFIALTNGILSLQPSEDAYKSSVGDADSVIFMLSEMDQKRIIDSHLNTYVSVRGKFTSGSENPLVGIGYFSGNVDVYRKIVRDEFEGVDQWKVRAQDLQKNGS